MPIKVPAVQMWAFCASTSQHSSRRRNVLSGLESGWACWRHAPRRHGRPSYRHSRGVDVTRHADTGITCTGWAGGRFPCSYYRMLIARAITSAPMPRDTAASVIISSLAHRLIAETSVGLNAVAVQNASDR